MAIPIAPILGAIGRAALPAGKALVKKSIKKKIPNAAKKNVHQTLEKRLISENKGDARMKGNINRLKRQEESGLISQGERHRALNRMTKDSKAFRAKLKRP